MDNCLCTGANWSNAAAIMTAVAALLTVVFTTLINKRKLAMQGFAVHRIDWIKEVRQMIGDFACEYIKGEEKDKEKMFAIQTRIGLFMRQNEEDYHKLLAHMTLCRENAYNELDYELLMLYSTYVLNRVWRRMMLEGKGKLLLSNKRIVELVNRETASLKALVDKKEEEKKNKGK